MKKVLLIGEPMALFAADEVKPLDEVTKFTKMVSGAEVNVGIGLQRLGFLTTFVTRLGEDVLGKGVYRRFQEENMDTSFISFDPNYSTGIQMKAKTEIGDPEVQYYRKNSAASHMTFHDIEKIDFSEIRHVHVTGIPPALSESCREAIFFLLKEAKKHKISTTFDPNLRPMLWENEETMIKVLNELASLSDMVLPGVSEGRLLTGKDTPEEIGKFYLEAGSSAVILKDGSKGAIVITEKGKEIVPGFQVDKVVDTVGAGDGFAVGVVSAHLEGLSLYDMALRGNAIGAIQVMSKGDNEGLPNREQLKNFMISRSK